MTPAAPTDTLPVLELARPAPLRVKATFAALVALSLGSIPGAALVGVMALGSTGLWPQITSTIRWLESTPFGLYPWIGTLAALLFATLVVDKVYQAHARRKYGCCRIDEDALELELALGPKLNELVAFDDVARFDVTRHGILIEVARRGVFARWMRPLLIPIASDDERARVIALLEAPREGPPGALSFGHPRPAWHGAALTVVKLGLAAPGLVLVTTRFGLPYLMGASLVLMGSLLVALYFFDQWELRPRWRPIHLGKRALLIGRNRIAWSDVTRVAWTAEDLVLEARGGARVLTRVAPRLAEARQLIEERLASSRPPAVQGHVPAWADPATRRTRARWMCAVLLALSVFGVAVGLSNPPIHDELVIQDDEGCWVVLVHRISDDAPRVVAVSQGIGTRDVETIQLDLPGLFGRQRFGIGAKGGVCLDVAGHKGAASSSFLFLQMTGVTTSPLARLQSEVPLPSALTQRLRAGAALWFSPSSDVDSIPAIFDELELPEDTLLREWLDGRIGRRTFEVQDASGWTLAWGAEQGAVLYCALVQPGAQLKVDMFACEQQIAGASVALAIDESRPLIRCDGPGRRLLELPGPLPTLDDLLRVRREVRAGKTIRDASPALRELMEAE